MFCGTQAGSEVATGGCSTATNGGQLVALDERFLEMANREGLAVGRGTFWLTLRTSAAAGWLERIGDGGTSIRGCWDECGEPKGL